MKPLYDSQYESMAERAEKAEARVAALEAWQAKARDRLEKWIAWMDKMPDTRQPDVRRLVETRRLLRDSHEPPADSTTEPPPDSRRIRCNEPNSKLAMPPQEPAPIAVLQEFLRWMRLPGAPIEPKSCSDAQVIEAIEAAIDLVGAAQECINMDRWRECRALSLQGHNVLRHLDNVMGREEE